MAQPFDAAMGLLDPEADTIAVRKEAMAGLGFAGRLEWSDRFRFAFAQDPEVQRLEAVISVHRDKTGRFYLGCGWVSFAGLDNWPFLLGEVRWRLQKGATAFARARALERSINGGGQRLVSDGMLGISWALALRRGN